MAVSGKKSEFSGSINVSSTEDFDHSCEPCLTASQYIEAHGYCLDCKEYLCKNCFTYHQRTKASKDHKLLNIDDIDKKGIPETHSEVCTEKCHIHTDEVIKFFCLQHEELACHDCVALNHRSCDLDYIPDKCEDIGDSEEFRKAAWLLSTRMAEVNYVIKKATNRRKEIDTHHEDLIKSIDKFQKDVNDRIQQIRKQLQTEIDRKNSLNKQNVEDVLHLCTIMSSDISELQTKLQVSKTTKQNGQLFIAIKQTVSKLKEDRVKKSEEELDKTNLQYKFEPNQDLQALLSKQEGFGKLCLPTSLVSPWKQVKLIKKGEINVQTELDGLPCSITGCAVLSSNKIILADYGNRKLKVLDTQSNLIVAEKKLDTFPRDVTTLPEDKLAVTLPLRKSILIMTLDNNLSTVHTIPVKGQCFGIAYHKDYLYTVCIDPKTVVITDTKGTVHNTISMESGQLKGPCYIVVRDSGLLYISDYYGKGVVSITSQGQISAVYKNHLGPTGLTLLDDGSLLMCCITGAIHHISANLKKGEEKKGGMPKQKSICYNNHQHKVYTGGQEYNWLRVFSLEYV